MRVPQRMMPHGGLVSYQAAAGFSSRGKVVAAAVTPERACIQEKRRLVKGATGEEVSTATVWLDPEHDPPVGTMVTIWKGQPRERTTRVIATERWEHGAGLPAHVELYCE